MSDAVFKVITTQLMTIVLLLGPVVLILLLGKRWGLKNWTQIGLAIGWIAIALIIMQATIWGGVPGA
jgi:Ca2+/Na+ antiporter